MYYKKTKREKQNKRKQLNN